MPEPVYDGFISYSHAADDLLAPRLQAGLQRFAKPWWRRRALRLFRDESSLSANPHLWSSIEEALDSSKWFVLLLSEDAADSEWVGREIEHWVNARGAGRIIPVVTSGEFRWADGDVAGSSVPPALRGVFSDEPRWVDLRFAKGDELLDLKNPEFAAAVADIASALRGIPKDELASEEVKQHRRTIRTAWAAGTLVAALGLAAVVFGIQANEQRQLAEANAQAAAENEAEAAANAEEALRQRDLAIENEAEAEAAAAEARRNEAFALQKAAVAEAGRLLDVAASQQDPAFTVSLALYAVAVAGGGVAEIQPQVVSLLHSALPHYRAAAFFPLPGGFGAVSPAGTLLYWVGSDWELTAFDVGTGEERWSRDLPRGTISANPMGMYSNPDGRMVAVPQLATGGLRLLVVSTTSGSLVADFVIESCAETGVELGVNGFSSDGQYLTVAERGACEGGVEGSWVRVFETTTWTEVLEVDAVEVSFSADSKRALVVNSDGGAELRTFAEWELLNEFHGNYTAGALAPDGEQMALASSSGPVVVVDAGSGAIFHEFAVDAVVSSEASPPLSFSPDGSKLAVMTTGSDLVVDVETGEKIAEFQNPVTWLHSWTEDGERLFIDSNSYALWYVGPEVLSDPLPLAFDDLLDITLERLGRGFVGPDCTDFRIEHCPLSATELKRMVESSRTGTSK